MASANKVKFGLKNVYYAKITAVSGGSYTYSTPVAIPGAVSLTGSPSGDSEDFYADNTIYYSSAANQGYEGELEVAMLPDSFLTDILGYTTDTNGALVENSSVPTAEFALGFQVEGDTKNRRTWYYNCSCTRPNNDAATLESSKTPQTQTMSIKMMPRITDNAVKVTMEESTQNTAVYATFLTSAVYEAQ